MITGAVLIFFPKALNEFSGVRNVVGFSRSIDEKQKCLFVSRLFLQHLLSGVARFRIGAERKKDRAKLQLYFGIVRLQFSRFLEQRVGLENLSSVEINAAQLAQRYWIVWGKSKDIAILLLGFVILLGGKIIVCTGEMLLLVLFLLCAPKTGDGQQR